MTQVDLEQAKIDMTDKYREDYELDKESWGTAVEERETK
jgi:hypothetical protein